MPPLIRTLSIAALPIMAVLSACSAEQQGDALVVDEAAPMSLASVRDISVSEAQSLLGQEVAPIIIDVRTPEEFDAGRIAGAINVNFRADDFAEQLASLDKDQAYLLHCKSGGRSTKALDVMKAQGFTDIAHMSEGYDGWKAVVAGE